MNNPNKSKAEVVVRKTHQNRVDCLDSTYAELLHKKHLSHHTV